MQGDMGNNAYPNSNMTIPVRYMVLILTVSNSFQQVRIKFG